MSHELPESPDSNRLLQLLEGVRAGDQEACQDFWTYFGPLIERVAQKQLSPGLQRRVGPETISLSACRTFFRRAQQGEFELHQADAIWRLLCAITVNKVRMQARHHFSQKRDLGREMHNDALPEIQPSRQTDASEEIAFAETLEHLLETFNEHEASVLQLRLDGYSNLEISEHLDVSDRTVRRMIQRIQARLSFLFDHPNDEDASKDSGGNGQE